MSGCRQGATRRCGRCERVRPIHGYGFCKPCYMTLRNRGHLPRPLDSARFPCQDCGLTPQELRYSGRRGLTRGRCPGCYERYRREQRQACCQEGAA